MNLVKNWTQLKRANIFTLEIIFFYWSEIFDILKIWQNLSIVFQTWKVFNVIGADVQIPWAFSQNLPFNVNLW